jgi:hypothetical protein
MDVLAATLGTLDLSLFVFVKAENEFKGLLAIFAVKLIARHGNLRKGPEGVEPTFPVYARGRTVSRDAKRRKRSGRLMEGTMLETT